MYKIIELNEKNIAQYKGKIIQVIDRTRREVVVGRDFCGCEVATFMWVLTCLVEE